MIARILAHTPAWVYVIFCALLVFGLIQTRTRTVGKTRALVLPFGMIGLSLAGISSSFGFKPMPLAAWSMALIFATTTGYIFFRDNRIHYRTTDQKFFIPGSWMPFAVMMAIFFAKYLYAVMRALNAEVVSTPAFIASLAATYGLLSGYFSSRAINLMTQVRKA